MEGDSLETWIGRVRSAERRGELLAAVDIAERGLTEHVGAVSLQHRLVLALARAGATDQAARRFAAFGLEAVADEEVAALSARIAKDRALILPVPERPGPAAQAAGLYEAIYERTGGYYPAINAATLWLVAGDAARSSSLAAATIGLLASEPENDYYAAATRAEAELLLGRPDAARSALAWAVTVNGEDYGALSTTRRQLRLICRLSGIDLVLLDILAGPAVAHFCGHIIAADGNQGRFPASYEHDLAERIAAVVAEHAIGYAYGALAAGADILWAEALLDAGAELHVVLPFDRNEFIRTSVGSAGAGWIARFEHCIARASDVIYATEDAFLGDDSLFVYGAELAMGLALARATYLDADTVQLAVWDGTPAAGDAGTAIDVARWRRGGGRTVALTPAGELVDDSAIAPDPPPRRVAEAGGGRVVRCLLFGDIRGFSKLTDEQLPSFAQLVLGAFAEVIGVHGDAVEAANTWGDALYLVVRDVERAAECALDLQRAMEVIDLAAAGLPDHLALRLGAHIGPVFPIHDPVIDQLGFMGSHVSRTARIEPVTPPGEVYVTSAFAAAVALSGSQRIRGDYVGHLPAAKDYGSLRMYRLWRREDDRESAGVS